MKRTKLFVSFLSYFLLLIFCVQDLKAQENQYYINIQQTDTTVFHFSIDITVPETIKNQDSLLFRFGGVVPEISIENLSITSKNEIVTFDFDKEKRIIKFLNTKKNDLFKFDYTLNSILNISKDGNAILIENSFDYSIPYILGTEHDNIIITGEIQNISNYYVITNLYLQDHIIHPTTIETYQLSIIFADSLHYSKLSFTTMDKEINIYTPDKTFSQETFKRLETKIADCFNFYADRILPYRFPKLDIVDFSWFISGSTDYGSLILIQPSEFGTYTLFHEITHEWIRGIIPVQYDYEGEFLFNEGLNEYLTLLFMKHKEGDSIYNSVIDNYTNLYNKYKQEKGDTSIMFIEKYTLSTHPFVIYKQVVLLNEFAQTVGFEKFNENLFKFLQSRVDKPTKTSDFIDFLLKKYNESASAYFKKI